MFMVCLKKKQGYRQEFSKIEENHKTRVEREQLLRGSAHNSNAGLSRRDMYLKENTHVHKYDLLGFNQIDVHH